MTIFHAIKYPLSDPPTWEQLDALPMDLFNQWLRDPSLVNNGFNARHRDPGNIALLRKLIAEYEE